MLKILRIMLLCLPLFGDATIAGAFTLLDKSCAQVDAEDPILLSDVQRRAKEKGLSLKDALIELLNERALTVYARKQLKFNMADIQKATNEHVKRIIEKNNLTPESFEKVLKSPDYSMSLKQYENETFFHILNSHVEKSLESGIEINPREAALELAKKEQDPNNFMVAFISVAPGRGSKSVVLSRQLARAKLIKRKISGLKNWDAIKKNVGTMVGLTLVAPSDYEEGALIPHYEAELKKNVASRITEPFIDNGAVTMIVKIEKKLDKKTALEKEQNALYKRAVQQRRDTITRDILANSPVSIYCER